MAKRGMTKKQKKVVASAHLLHNAHTRQLLYYLHNYAIATAQGLKKGCVIPLEYMWFSLLDFKSSSIYFLVGTDLNSKGSAAPF